MESRDPRQGELGSSGGMRTGLSSRPYRLLVWVLVVVILAELGIFGTRTFLYYHALYRSWKLTGAYYGVRENFKDFKMRYEDQRKVTGGGHFINDYYSRRFYRPQVGNALGLLNCPAALEPKAGVTRLLCIGTSTTERGYPDELRALLDSRRPGKFEVINAGIPGSSYMNYFMNYSLLWRSLRPSYVLIEQNVDDIFPRAFTPPDIESTGEFVLEDFERAVVSDAPPRTAAQVGKMLGTRAPEELVAVRCEALLRALVETVKGSGAVPVFVTYEPALSWTDRRGQFSDRFLDDANNYYIRKYEPLSVDTALKVLHTMAGTMCRLAREQGIPLVDASTVIPRRDACFVDGTHHSSEGSRIVAEKIYGCLAENTAAAREELK